MINILIGSLRLINQLIGHGNIPCRYQNAIYENVKQYQANSETFEMFSVIHSQ